MLNDLLTWYWSGQLVALEKRLDFLAQEERDLRAAIPKAIRKIERERELVKARIGKATGRIVQHGSLS